MREKAALEAERKEAFAAKKEADLRAREERKAQRALEAEQSAQRRAVELEAQRAEFEADRRAAYRIGLSKTRSGFLGKIGSLLSGGAAIDDAVMDDLEAILFTSDIGARTADRLLEDLKQRRGSGRLKNADAVFTALREELASIVNLPAPSLFDDLKAGETKVVMLVGVNGVGKTTSMGKLAHRAKQGGTRSSSARATPSSCCGRSTSGLGRANRLAAGSGRRPGGSEARCCSRPCRAA